jgi:hypothetical protein
MLLAITVEVAVAVVCVFTNENAVKFAKGKRAFSLPLTGIIKNSFFHV